MKTSKYFYSFKLFLLLSLSGINFAQTMHEINLVDQYGGFINQIANSSQDLFICQSHAFRIADIFNNQPKVYSTTLLPWEGWEAFADETMAFVSKQNMIMSIDFSNLSNIIKSPVVSLGQNNAETITSIFANTQYVFTTQYNMSTKTGTFRILNRNSLSEVGSVNIVCQQVQVVNNIAYVITGHVSMGTSTQILKAYNVANPSSITELGSLLLNNCERLQVVGNYAYVVGLGRSGLTIVDISNPSSMTLTADKKGPLSSLRFISVLGNYAYGSSFTDFYSIDISNKTNPIQIGSVNLGSSVIMEQIIYPNVQQFLQAYLMIDGQIKILDISTPANITLLDPYDSPATVDCITDYQDNLFIGDGSKIWKCPVDRLHVDNHFLVANNKFIRAQDGILYVASDEGNYDKLTLYDISDINNPIKKGEYQTNGNLNKFEILDKNAYLIFQDSATLEIINCSNPNSLNKVSTFPLGGNGYEIFISSTDKLAYIGYYNSTADLKEAAIINVSNTITPILVSKVSTHAIPYAIYVDGNNLFVGGSKDQVGEWFLQAFDITNKENPILLTQLVQTGIYVGEGLYDIYASNGKLVVTIKGIGVRTYELTNSSSGSVFKAVSSISNGPTFNQTGENAGVKYAHDLLTYPDSYGSGLYGYSNGVPSGTNKGYKGVFKFKIPDFFPPISNKVNLTMSIKPAEAVNHGCNTIPAPGGPYEYNKGEIVQLTAMDNPPEGWNFKEWTGSASGTNPQVPLLMDENKNVIANFVEVKLTVSGSAVEEALCPAAANLTSKNKLLPIVLCASPASGWAVQGITFKTSGTGDMLKDVWALKVYKGTEIIAIGSLEPVRNAAESHVSFSPPLIVPANECVTLRLCYIFVYDETTYAIDTTYTFLVETKNVNATPLEYPEGLIEGKAKRNGPFTIARIYNEWGIGFSKIQDAVNSEFTQDGSTCYLCDGIYTENVLINEKSKEVTVTSVNGKEKTFVKHKNLYQSVFLIADKFNVKIQNLTFESSKEGSGSAISVHRSGSIMINKNTFKNLECGIIIGDETKYSTSEENLFDSNDRGIAVVKAENNTIRNNTFTNSFSDEPDLSIFKGKNNKVHENTILQPGGRLNIHLWQTELNRIFSNNAFIPTGAEKYSNITLEESHNNEISRNLCFEFYAKESNSNKIENNEMLKIEIRDSELNDIKGNNVSGQGRISADGIYLDESEKNTIEGNTITYNEKNGIKIESLSRDNSVTQNRINYNKENGIQIIDSHDLIMYKNTIDHNQFNGIDFNKGSGAVYKNTIYNNVMNGVFVNDAGGIDLFENKITGHDKSYQVDSYKIDAAGVYFINARNCYINRNVFKENCTAIHLFDSENINVSANEVNNSFCWFTGIHLNNSEAEIAGNNIIDNQGNGVFFSNNSKGTVRANNIYGNTGSGVNNSDASVTINAQNNWWGKNTGPEPKDVSGNFIVSSWLSEPLSLFCNAARDTIYTSASKTDSSLVHFQNYKFPDDVLDITISDEKGWITSPASFSSQMQDSMGISANIIFNIPADVNEGIINKVMIVARSKSEVSVSVKDSLYISIYKQLLKEMSITPDSTTIAVGDSLRFSAYGYDQYGKSVQIYPKWQTTLGQINSQGFFKCSSSGKAIITVTDSLSGIVAKAVIIVEDIVSVTGEKDIPTIYNLFQNYPNPFNPTTTINYLLPAVSFVTLKVYDILGREVVVLVNKEQMPGIYKVEFNGSRFASGVYIYRITAGKFTAVKKLVLMK